VQAKEVLENVVGAPGDCTETKGAKQNEASLTKHLNVIKVLKDTSKPKGVVKKAMHFASYQTNQGCSARSCHRGQHLPDLTCGFCAKFEMTPDEAQSCHSWFILGPDE
jgi:hypothetical protein